jgi:hypothetical protein
MAEQRRPALFLVILRETRRAELASACFVLENQSSAGLLCSWT